MKAVRNALKEVLKHDVILQAYVGRDSRNEPKVYESLAKKDVQAPFVVWTLLPGLEPEGTYGDSRSIEVVFVQVTAWGRNRDEAWEVYENIQIALELAEWDVYLAPYALMDCRRQGDQLPIEDADTGWIQVPVTYRVRVTR